APASTPAPEKKAETPVLTEIQAEKINKEKLEREKIQKKYAELADKIKALFPEGSVVVHIKEKEDEIQLAFGTNANLCQLVRKNLEDYKKKDKIDSGNNFTLPRSNKLIQLLNDDRQAIWKEVFQQPATSDEKKSAPKSPTIIVKRNTASTTPPLGASLTASAHETLYIKGKKAQPSHFDTGTSVGEVLKGEDKPRK
ncbi:MAG TPA: hypothetical protein VLH77_00760, partial [Gammaproteobacteria bacterium]|nr:hypothetical protein [Gammaproteobacteria bacterium]